MRESVEVKYWNTIYANLTPEPPVYDPWLDKHSALIERSADSVVIDLGCGNGVNTIYLMERGYRVMACDLSEEALNNVALHVPTASVMQLNMLQGLPFGMASAKVIIADLSLHYFTWSDTVRIVHELQRVLQPEGVLLARVNSTEDIEFGAGQGEEIEPYLFEHEGRTKRFFDEIQIRRLFVDWSIEWLQATTMHRYGKPKQCWELAVVNQRIK